MESTKWDNMIRSELFWSGSFTLVSEKDGEIIVSDNVSSEQHTFKTWDDVHSFLYDQKWENNRF